MNESNPPNKFDVAAFVAEEDLISLLNKMTEEEKNGALIICKWHSQHYMKAGHKRLGRILVKNVKGTPKITKKSELTKAELYVLRAAQSGALIREIAEELGITHGTTRNHLSRIYSKLEARNRQEAITKARELGLLN